MIRNRTARRLVGAGLFLLAAGAALSAGAAERRYPEPPVPGRPNFPQRPPNEPRLVNPIPQSPREINPRNDPDVDRGARRHYQEHWRKR